MVHQMHLFLESVALPTSESQPYFAGPAASTWDRWQTSHAQNRRMFIVVAMMSHGKHPPPAVDIAVQHQGSH
jgi:hypothetical protein